MSYGFPAMVVTFGVAAVYLGYWIGAEATELSGLLIAVAMFLGGVGLVAIGLFYGVEAAVARALKRPTHDRSADDRRE